MEKREFETPEQIEKRLRNILTRSTQAQWYDFKKVVSAPPPVVKQRPSRPSFDQQLTPEDRAFLADLKVGL